MPESINNDAPLQTLGNSTVRFAIRLCWENYKVILLQLVVNTAAKFCRQQCVADSKIQWVRVTLKLYILLLDTNNVGYTREKELFPQNLKFLRAYGPELGGYAAPLLPLIKLYF